MYESKFGDENVTVITEVYNIRGISLVDNSVLSIQLITSHFTPAPQSNLMQMSAGFQLTKIITQVVYILHSRTEIHVKQEAAVWTVADCTAWHTLTTSCFKHFVACARRLGNIKEVTTTSDITLTSGTSPKYLCVLQIEAKPLWIATWLLLTAYSNLPSPHISNGTIADPLRHTI